MERPTKRIKLEEGVKLEEGSESVDQPIERRDPPLPSTPDQHGGVDLIDSSISVVVGTGAQKQSFDIHKGLLRHYSGDLRRIIEHVEQGLNNGVTAATILLPREDPEIFELFRNWLYTPTHKLGALPASDVTLEMSTLVELWCFADRQEIPLLGNYIVDIAVTKFCKSSELLHLEDVKVLYEYEPCSVGLQELFAWRAAPAYGAFAHSQPHDWLDQEEEKWFKTFCVASVQERVCLGRSFDHWQEKKGFDACVFHEHEDGVACRRKGGWRAYV